MTELPRWVLTHAEKLNKLGLARVDLRRSWQMHSWLAFTYTAAGAVLAALYLYTSWPDTPTSVHLAVIAFNTSVILLSAVVLGIAAAVIVQSLDPRIYDGTDVEYMLGVEPMVELPEVGELSDEEMKELFLPLAGGIIHACLDDAQRRCIFTGTSGEIGVTTIAARTKETLEAIGRSVVFMDADGATHGAPNAETGGDQADANGAGKGGGLILTDTEPLVSSADTEYLARFADCVIVVAESGVTTREQLRKTVKCLQRLNVAAVGFVLNRAKDARPGVKPRKPVTELKMDSGQFAAAVQRALAQPEGENKVPSKSAPRPQPAASLTREVEAPKTDKQTLNPKRAQQSAAWEQPGVPRWLSDALGQLEAPHLTRGGGRMTSAPAKTSAQETAADQGANHAPDSVLKAGAPQAAWDRNGSAAPLEKSVTAQTSTNSFGDPDCGSNSEPQGAQARSSQTAAAPPVNKPSRLSGLRGIVSASHLRGLGQARRTDAGACETPTQFNESWSEETKEAMPAGHPSAYAGDVDASGMRLGDLRGLITPENLKDLNQARYPLAETSGTFERGNGSRPPARESSTSADHPTSAPSVTDLVNGAEPTTAAEPQALPAKSTATPDQERIAPYGEVQVLPSRRGQYRKR